MLNPELNTPINISVLKWVRNRVNTIIGIYKITSPKGHINIGQAIDIENRFTQYRSLCCKRQPRLYRSLKKHGVRNHTFEIIHLCEESELNYWENYYVKLYDTFNTKHGLNLREGGGARGKLSDESKKRLSKSQKERFNFLSYEKCKKWVQENELTKNIKTANEWMSIRNKIPVFIPKAPITTYEKEGWKGWGDFLGTGRKYKGDFLDYEETKKWIQKNTLTKKVKTQKEWKKITKTLPSFIPKDPKGHYTRFKNWKGWGDFLGTNFIATQNRIYYDYEKCKKLVRENKLTKNIKSKNEWNKIKNNLPSFTPKDVEGVYLRTGEWKGWGDFLGTGLIANKNRLYYDYEKCKKWVQKNKLTKNIKTQKEWEELNKYTFPLFIPKDPPSAYRKQSSWKGWGDFLGTGNKNKGDFLSYKEVKIWVKENELTKNIKSRNEWDKIKSKLPSFIPKSPAFIYKNKGWIDWSSFLKDT